MIDTRERRSGDQLVRCAWLEAHLDRGLDATVNGSQIRFGKSQVGKMRTRRRKVYVTL